MGAFNSQGIVQSAAYARYLAQQAQQTPAAPAAPLLNPSDTRAAALQAGAVQRKKALRGSVLTRPLAPVWSVLPTTPRLLPRALVGL